MKTTMREDQGEIVAELLPNGDLDLNRNPDGGEWDKITITPQEWDELVAFRARAMNELKG